MSTKKRGTWNKERVAKMLASRKATVQRKQSNIPQAVSHLRFAVTQIGNKNPATLTNLELAVILAFKALTEA